ncbi:helix-turn-helix transcriptional regulator [Arsenophonus sp. PmNCSU2021_1]|uniref:helix-turn-helix transcriptional regulator n=1 Tax=Arsenophonus sp. PmNCSU2021_1 TaxID=3118989 RepID=UPI002FEF0778
MGKIVKKQSVNKNSDDVNLEGNEHSSSVSELGCGNFQSRMMSLLSGFKSVSAFAQAVGISTSGMNRLLSGGTPTLPVLLNIAKSMDVSVEWLATGKQIAPMAHVDNDKKTCSTELADKWLDVLEGLSKDEQEHVLQSLRREGTKILLKIPEPGTVTLLDLSGKRREIALLLAAMDDKQVREILEKIYSNTGKQEIDWLTNKASA